jgi:hypothetical protein
MAVAFEVRLPKHAIVRFPARCVACAVPSPARTFRVATHAIGWWTALFVFGDRVGVDVPACEPCARTLAWRRRGRILSSVVFVVAGVLAATSLVDYHGPFRKWVLAPVALAVCLPWILWSTFFPPVVELTAYSEHVDYEFRDRSYAEDFASVNDTTVTGRDPGGTG